MVTPPSAVGARARPSRRTAAQLLQQKVFRRDLQRLGAQIMASIATCDASENSNGLLVIEPPTPLKNMSWDDDISN